MPKEYSGALQPKKKLELQEIASALRISDQGTKDELSIRIKKHLDANQATLEEDPAFVGLFGRRKRSLQPQPQPQPPVPPSSRFAPVPDPWTSEATKSFVARRVIALDAIRESTPVKDLRDVSTQLKNPISPTDSTPFQSPQRADPMTPTSLPLPPSPARSDNEDAPPPPPDIVLQPAMNPEEAFLQRGNEMFVAFRAFLSSSRNIWSLTALFEIIYILALAIPWQTVQIPLSAKGDSSASVPLMYPPWSIFQTSAIWTVVLHWAIPTLIVPAVVGNIISFNPAIPPAQFTTATQVAPFDPLTASIIRLAAQIAYPFASIEQRIGIQGLDVLGFRWRILAAGVGLAFAFAEAIAGAPRMFALTLLGEQREEKPSSRRALTSDDTVVGEIEG